MTNPTGKLHTARECWVEPQIVLLDSKESAIYLRNGPDGSSYANSTRS